MVWPKYKRKKEKEENVTPNPDGKRQPIETNPERIELTDKNGKAAAPVLSPVIKSVEENKDTLRRGMEVQKSTQLRLTK